MNILIFDNNHQLIQFQATIDWAREFLLNTRLYSKDPVEVQNYIEKSITTPNVFSHACKILSPKNIYNLSDKSVAAQIPGEAFVPNPLSGEPYNEEETWGLVIVDCQRKKVASLCMLDDGPINDFNSIDMQCYHRRAPHHQGQRPGVFANLAEQRSFITRLNELFEAQYWSTHDYESTTLKIKEEPTEEVHRVHAQLKSDLKRGTFDEPHSSSENVFLILNPKTTGWAFNQSSDPSYTGVSQDFIQMIFTAGITFTPEQEAIWQSNYGDFESATDNPLDWNFLYVAREKELIKKHAPELLLPTDSMTQDRVRKNKI